MIAGHRSEKLSRLVLGFFFNFSSFDNSTDGDCVEGIQMCFVLTGRNRGHMDLHYHAYRFDF